MIAKFKNKGLIIALPGLILQIIGAVFFTPHGHEPPIGASMIFLGAICLMIGFIYYAKAKGLHWAIGFVLAWLSYLGLIIILLLPDVSDRIKSDKKIA